MPYFVGHTNSNTLAWAVFETDDAGRPHWMRELGTFPYDQPGTSSHMAEARAWLFYRALELADEGAPIVHGLEEALDNLGPVSNVPYPTATTCEEHDWACGPAKE